MNPSLFIAVRYLFARKSHNVINVISAVSTIGMALGTAALVLILSVYNGFNKVIDDNLSSFDPDIKVCGYYGDYDVPEDLFDTLCTLPEVDDCSRTLEFEAFLTYGEVQSAARLIGTDGDISLRRGDLKLAALGVGLARRLGVNVHFLDPLTIYSPDRDKKISPLNPMESMRKVEVYPDHLFSVSGEIDGNTVMIPLETARELFGREDAVSSVDIRLKDNSDREVRKFIRNHISLCGHDFTMKDKYDQHPELYRMMRLEKAAVFLILLFVVLIVALNIFGCLSMLIVEKQEDIGTLRALGAEDNMIRDVFTAEGCLISMAGMLVGLVAGVALALVQQHFGLVRMPGNYLVEAYPVVLQLKDVIISAVGVGLIGLCISLISSRQALQ